MTDFVCGKAHIVWAKPKQLLPDWELTKTLRIMKLTAVFLFFAALQVSAKGLAQEKINLSLKNVLLEKVFDQIETQTGFVFLYKDETIKDKKVSIQVTNASINEALDICLREFALTYQIIGRSIAIKIKTNNNIGVEDGAIPPFIDIRGRVLNEKGEPVAGVSVAIKGATTVILTDANGEFSLNSVDRDATLIFTHISMETFQVKVSGKSELLINLKTKIASLGNVTVTVNTGYQQLPKERATGSFVEIDKKLYNEQVGTNIIDRLKYISNGIVPFSNRVGTLAKDQILIRGLSTLTMSIQKPLIIVDNFEYQGDLNNINPNDIENVTFLKDAAAGSIWGAKAANGVIVVTTKKSKYNQKIRVEVNSNVTVIDKPDLYYLKNISATDLIDVELYLFNQKYRFADTSRVTHPPFSPVYEILFKRRNGLISFADSAQQIDALRGLDVRNDFDKYFYQKAVNQQYSVILNGGSNNLAWVLSAGVDKNISDLDAKYNRFNIRLNQVYKLTSKLELSTAILYTQSKTASGKPAYGSIVTNQGQIPVYSKLADDNGESLPLYTQYRQGYIDTLGAGKFMDWRYYPLEDYKHENQNVNLKDLNATVGLNYKIFDFLKVDVKYRYERQQTDTRFLHDRESYYTRNLINGYSQLNRNTGVVTYIVPKGDILDMTGNAITAQNLRGQINFDKDWNKHSVVALLGSELSETINESNSYRTYGYNGDILTYGNVDYTKTYPNFISGSSFIPNTLSFSKGNTRFTSFFTNLAYTFDGRYTISFSARRDGSNLFGLSTNDKWKPLWSAGGSWEISKESFFKLDFLPYLRLRATYGHQGNIDPSKVAVTTFSYNGTNALTQTPYSVIQNYINPDLRWEQVGMLNFGLDFSAKNNRISGSIEYFEKKITDLYARDILDPSTGLPTGAIVRNIGNMRGQGVDFELNTINLNGPLRWNSNFILNTYKDKIKKFNSSTKASDMVNNFIGYEGYSSFALFAYRWAGLDPANGDPQGYLDDQVSKNWSSITGTGSTLSDIKYVGSRLPTVYGSLGNTFSWNGISLSIRLNYKFGYYFQRPSINYANLVGSLSGHSDYSSRWQKAGDESTTNVPSFVYPANSSRDIFYQNSEVLVSKGDNVRLQYINLNYELNRRKISKLPFETIQVYSVINNLGIIWRADNVNYDPDFASFPPSKSISFGIRASF